MFVVHVRPLVTEPDCTLGHCHGCALWSAAESGDLKAVWGCAQGELTVCVGAADMAAQARRPDVVSEVCKSMKRAAQLSDRAALYI